MNMQHDLIKTYMGKLILAPLPFDQPNLRVLDSGTFNGKSPLCRFDPLETNRRRPLARRRLDPPPVPHARRHRRLPNRLPSQAPPEHRVPRPVHLGPLAHRMARLVRPRPPETGDCMRAPRRRPAGAVPTHRPRQARHRLGAIHRRQSRASDPGAAEAIPCSRALPVAGGGDAASFPLEPRPGKLVRQWLEEYGLQEVQEKVMEIPIGAGNPDPKLGEMAKQNMLEVVSNFRTAATRKFCFCFCTEYVGFTAGLTDVGRSSRWHWYSC